MLNRRALGLAGLSLLPSLVRAQPAPGPASGPTPGWDGVVAAAKREGTVNFYTGLLGNDSTRKINDAFQARYGVRVSALEVRATELRERIRTERIGNNATGDVVHTSSAQVRQMWMEDKTVDPLGDLPNASGIRTDISDDWQDRAVNIPTFLLTYGMLANSRLAPGPVTSWKDLLDPRFKGRILADDFRAPGGGNSFFSVTSEKLGGEFEERLAGQNVAFTRDQREAERRVARGEYALYLPWLLNYLPALKGLPVYAVVPSEGAIYTPYASGILSRAPHPNAARLLIDFMLSDEGQAIYAAEGLLPTRESAKAAVPQQYAFYANAKLLGSSRLERVAETLAGAKTLYK